MEKKKKAVGKRQNRAPVKKKTSTLRCLGADGWTLLEWILQNCGVRIWPELNGVSI